ncbi:MAG: ferrochelatase [Chloroflexi bacterium]|nr:ferrochelatase [Chloroflexota bacterium]
MTGVLLMAYGTPAGPDEVGAFYTHIRGGRPPDTELLQRLEARYEAIGGRSPLLEITKAQAAALQEELGPAYRVWLGMKHWHPYIRQSVDEMSAAGIRRAVAVALAPHYSKLSVGAYFQAIDEANQSIEFAKVQSWHLQPEYLAAIRERITQASSGFEPEAVIFTAHSLPRRILNEGDPYVEQLGATAQAIAAELHLPHWRFAFQSAGATGDAWLGPDILQALQDVAAEGARRVLVAPIGFISDHLEILYDLDVQAQARASDLGLQLRRTESLNAAPKLIAALADTVRRASPVQAG